MKKSELEHVVRDFAARNYINVLSFDAKPCEGPDAGGEEFTAMLWKDGAYGCLTIYEEFLQGPRARAYVDQELLGIAGSFDQHIATRSWVSS